MRADRQTDRHTRSSQYFALLSGGKVTNGVLYRSSGKTTTPYTGLIKIRNAETKPNPNPNTNPNPNLNRTYPTKYLY